MARKVPFLELLVLGLKAVLAFFLLIRNFRIFVYVSISTVFLRILNVCCVHTFGMLLVWQSLIPPRETPFVVSDLWWRLAEAAQDAHKIAPCARTLPPAMNAKMANI